MRIALVTHNIIKNDGQGRVTYELARYLAASGEEVHLFTHRADPDLLRMPNIRLHTIPALQATNLVKSITFGVFSLFAVWLGKYDIVHNNGDALFRPTAVNSCHFCHSAPFSTESAPALSPSYLYKRLYHAFHVAMERFIYCRSGVVIAVSRTIADDLKNEVGVSPSRIIVVHNGVDPDQFQPRRGARNNRPSQDTLRVLFVGDLTSRRKGLDTVLLALRRLEGSITLSIAGNATKSAYVSRVQRSPRLREIVEFLGFRKDMPDLYGAHDVLAFPSLYEPFGLSVLEAMSCGLVVIVSRRAGAAELIDHGKNGFILEDPRDVQALAMYLLRLSQDSDLRRRIGRQARETALRCTWEQMAAQVHQLYRQVAAKNL